MHTEFVHPNFHVVLVHFPIALIVVGTLIELLSFLWRRSGFRQAGRWMLLIGALAMIPTAFSGVYALSDVARMNNPAAANNWNAVLAAAPLDALAWDRVSDHVWAQAIATVLLAVAVVIWLGCSDQWRCRLHWPLMIVILAGVLFAVSGAWHGGEMVYRSAIGVGTSNITLTAPILDPSDGVSKSPSILADEPAWRPNRDATPLAQFERVLPPVQTHVLFAGWAVAIALAALGLSFRAAHGVAWYPVMLDHPESMPQPAISQANPGEYFSPAMPSPSAEARESVPSGRFWMLTIVLLIITAAGGWWALGSGSLVNWSSPGLVNHLWSQVNSPDLNPDGLLNRRSAHLLTAGIILICPIILLCSSRWARGNIVVVWTFGLILLLAVAVQIRLGVLLLYDGPAGPVTQFSTDAPPPTTAPIVSMR